jgi:hypothetical protein
LDDDKTIDSFDDLFEPFQLDETPSESDLAAQPPVYEERLVACPSCGTRNPADNRHCESCGARIAQGPLPVAPPPMLRTTPGARALGVLAAVILVVALAALLFDFFRGSGDSTPPDSTVAEQSTTVPTLPPVEVAQLLPFTVEASSELPGWEAANLIDADATNSWNDASLRGDGALLTFRFERPVQISQIVIHNLTDEERFRRNYRIKGLEISINDLPTKALEVLDDTMEPQAIQIASVETTEVMLRVTSTYEAEAFNGQTPFTELALQEVKFFGRASPTAGTTG